MSASSAVEKKPPAVPRPSSSVVVVNSKNEILLVHRNPDSKSFAGVHVFPGGNYDARQDTSMELTAIRETFEESGILLASANSPSRTLSNDDLDVARKSIHAQKMSFVSFLSENGLEPDVHTLLPFTQWITPASVPRRFHTHFFVTFLSPSSLTTPGASDGHRHQLPTPDGGQEVIAARFLHPHDALAEFAAGSISLMPPQFYLIHTLAACLPTRIQTPEQRAIVAQLSHGAFGAMVINPRPLPSAEDDLDGRRVLTYEGDETRGGKKGRLHRSLLRFGKGGVPTEVVLLRNFDVFTEIEPHIFSPSSRL